MATAMQFAETFAKSVKFADFTIHYEHFSTDSQKVLFALRELELLCHMNSIYGWQRYDSEYMDLSQNVPALQDGSHVISECNVILHHIDNVVSSDKALFPEGHTIEGQRVKHYSELLDSVSLELLKYGSIVHQDLLHGGREMSGCAFRKIKAYYLNHRQKLETLCEKTSEYADSFEKIIKKVTKLHNDVGDKEKLRKHLEILHKVFDEIEKELQHREQEFEDRSSWLCTGHITNADLSLAVLLSTLYLYGYSSKYWSRKKRPFLNRYFNKLYKRKSFYNSCIRPYTCRGAVTTFVHRRPVLSVFLGVTVLSSISLGYLWYKRGW